MLRSLSFRKGLFIKNLNRFYSHQSHEKPFEKLLIANRGEIACRIIKTAKTLGIKTVAIYSEPDSKSLHVNLADEAYCLGGHTSKESYLDMQKVIDIAKKSGAQAIHPGYGFLSENPHFVDLVEASGIVFVGPPASSMQQMGDKINSKLVAKAAGCYVIPGYDGEVENEEIAIKIAQEIGYPVMIKASAGGGGKGMRIAYTDDEAREGFKLSKSEAMSSFGDDRMLIEKFIEEPHHIEIQVLADHYGNVVAFPERECSVQRRNQKVIEESPSCLLTLETRRKMQQQAIALCRATGYRSAGTVEMLADNHQNFYFLEMNTRLQVEHPITELVSGEDLVKHMLYIASGKPLPSYFFTPTPLSPPPSSAADVGKNSGYLDPIGWAIEARVYAEDPLRNFLPSIGPLISLKEPHTYQPTSTSTTSFSSSSSSSSTNYEHRQHEIEAEGEGDEMEGSNHSYTVRLDTGVREGDSITMYYDPMISKLCTHAPTRHEAIQLMNRAIDEYYIRGVNNNLTFISSIMKNKRFQSGKYGTNFIPLEYPNGFHGIHLSNKEIQQLLAFTAGIHLAKQESKVRASITPILTSQYMNPDDVIENTEMVMILSSSRYHKPNHGNDSSSSNSHGDDVIDHAYYVKTEMNEGLLTVHITPTHLVYKQDDFSEHRTHHKNTVTLHIRDLMWMVESPLGSVYFTSAENEDKEEIFQYEGCSSQLTESVGGVGEIYYIRYHGSQQKIEIRTLDEHKLAHYVPKMEKIDTSKYLLCPMPGTMISCAVKEGQSVEEGQQIAIVEAMKMQNILRAPKKGIIEKIYVTPGSHLKVDQKIVAFHT